MPKKTEKGIQGAAKESGGIDREVLDVIQEQKQK
jgi:hypothetical protein